MTSPTVQFVLELPEGWRATVIRHELVVVTGLGSALASLFELSGEVFVRTSIRFTTRVQLIDVNGPVPREASPLEVQACIGSVLRVYSDLLGAAKPDRLEPASPEEVQRLEQTLLPATHHAMLRRHPDQVAFSVRRMFEALLFPTGGETIHPVTLVEATAALIGTLDALEAVLMPPSLPVPTAQATA